MLLWIKVDLFYALCFALSVVTPPVSFPAGKYEAGFIFIIQEGVTDVVLLPDFSIFNYVSGTNIKFLSNYFID